MRTLFGALAALLGLASICLTARYGYKSADTTILPKSSPGWFPNQWRSSLPVAPE